MRQRARNAARADRYGKDHRAQREAWKPIVATGTIHCARGGEPLDPTKPWDLDHLDDGSEAPSCATHNRARIDQVTDFS